MFSIDFSASVSCLPRTSAAPTAPNVSFFVLRTTPPSETFFSVGCLQEADRHISIAVRSLCHELFPVFCFSHSFFHLQILLFPLGMYASCGTIFRSREKNRGHGRGVRGEQTPRHANDDVNTANVNLFGNGGGSIVTCTEIIVNDTDASLVTLADTKPQRWQPETQPAVQLNLRKKRNELPFVTPNFGGHRDFVVPCTMLARMLRELRHRDASDRARSRCCGAKWPVGFNSPHKTFGNCVGSSAPAKPESMKNSFNNNRRFSSRPFTKTCENCTK